MNQSSPIVRTNLTMALVGMITKLHPLNQARNPVMFVIYCGTLAVTLLYGYHIMTGQPIGGEPHWFTLWVALWLWFTILFANFAESLAERKGKAQAEALRSLRRDVEAKRLRSVSNRNNYQIVYASSLRANDIVLVETGQVIPGDGKVVDGIASVDESAITGESAPVIRESDGSHDVVTGGTRVLSDWLVIRITSDAGETFIDRMVALVEGAKRHKTPNEMALFILLTAFTLIFLLLTVTLLFFSEYSVRVAGGGTPISLTMLIALLVCLAPTTIGGLLSAISIAGMNRLMQANVIASSGRSVEAAGDVNCVLLDKTGTITHGNRQAVEVYPAEGVDMRTMMTAALLSSLADQTPEGKSIVQLARTKYQMEDIALPADSEFIEFSAETRYSGLKIGARYVLKGSSDVMAKRLAESNNVIPEDVKHQLEEVGRAGGTPLVVVDANTVLGVIYLKDVIKAGIKERLSDLRRMGIRSVMITGDNPLTCAAIAAEVGVDDYKAEATPEDKLILIRKMQADGEVVAMVGDGTNDAPALAQSDVAMVMNSGTQAAKEAGNMIDLDSDPTKLIEIVKVGKQMLMTRGSLTTFSITNDITKYFAIIPAAFASTYPSLQAMNIMHLNSPVSAMLSAIIFNAILIIAMIPVAMTGVNYRPIGASALLRRNLLVYGGSGIIVPFIGIKLIDMMLPMLGVL